MTLQPEFDAFRPAPTPPDPALEARRAAAHQELAELLQDPAFRAIEGFPTGSDAAILALSDPPYYTACPNPFLLEILQEWQAERAALRQQLALDSPPRPGQEPGERYSRDPFAADVSEGKNDPIYNAHSYHTKVPHKAIMRYILHYTDPGDVVFDGFCGTGMTGVAAQLCGDRRAVTELGYRVDADGGVWDGDKRISRLGARKAVLNDLSPAATFIAYNYNTPVDAALFEREARRILGEVERECGWMYETWHPNCDHPERVKARINYTVWSEVQSCPSCNQEIVFSDVALDTESGHIKDVFSCPNCEVFLKKEHLDLNLTTYYDPFSRDYLRSPKRKPILINYSIGKKKFEKIPDRFDLEILEKIDALGLRSEMPVLELPDMQMARVGRMKTTDVRYVHQFFLSRQAQALSVLWKQTDLREDKRLKHALQYFIEQAIWGMSVLNRYSPSHFSQVNRALSGVFYVASQISEVSPWYNLGGKLERLIKAFQKIHHSSSSSAISTENLGSLKLNDGSIDYIFTDPPFGENIYYSDLNILVESWHGVRTAPFTEAIVDRVKSKDFQDYERRMADCFNAYFRALKPGHWMTVEFHNSKDSVWNAIQSAIQQAGFVIADVRTLNKIQGSFQQVTSTTAVKQDLVISAYKPNGNLEDTFRLKAGTQDGAWEFLRYHLGKLPVVNLRDGQLVSNAERQAYLLFDRMVAFHIQHGVMVPISAPEFYAGLEQRFIPRDGMYYLPEQVSEYDRARLSAAGVVQIPLLVTDEKTAIAWVRQQLDPQVGGAQTAAELNPKFKLALHQAKHELAPELADLLEQNFLQDEAGRWYLPDPGKAEDLDRLRRRALLREFAAYQHSQGRLRQFRSEAVRAGFLDCLERQNYAALLAVARRLPDEVLRSDPDLLMYYDSAVLRGGDE